jgi:NADH-quinone oxidoreductase subunit A
MEFKLANILVFVGLGTGFLVSVLVLGWLLRPKVDEAQKLSIYECGETPVHRAWFNFNPRFYIVALVFLIFDVEVAFTYPVAVVFKKWVAQGNGLYAFFEILLFVGILAVGLAYVWIKGDLEWVRHTKEDAEWKLIATRLPPTREEMATVESGEEA